MSETIHILGAGSLGLLWAARCERAGLDCRLIMRRPHAAADWHARDDQLVLEQQGQLTTHKVKGELAGENQQPITHLIVSTKAWASAEALESIAPRLQPESHLLLLQNGLGSQQAASDRFPDRRVLYASVTDGAWKRAANHVVWAGAGQTSIGDPRQQPAPGWLTLLTRAGIDWRWEPDILSTLWVKLAINCAINPISALHDCLNGEVVDHAGTSFAPLLAELHMLLTSQKVALSLEQLHRRILEVIQATSGNSSSMRQDLQARRRTEIDFIVGHACRTAHQAGLATPILNRLHRQLQNRLAELDLPQD